MLGMFPPFRIQFMAIAILASIATVGYAAYKLYSHGVAFAEFQNQAQANERAKMIVGLQQENLLALRDDEKQARKEKEKYQQERNDLQARVDQARAEKEQHNQERNNLQARVDAAESQIADMEDVLDMECPAIPAIKECDVNDIITLPGGAE